MKRIILLLAALALLVAPAAAETVNVSPYGLATPYWYGYSAGAVADYYLAAPTLSANDTACGIAATQTLTNKTLTSPTLTGATISSPTITSPTITGGTLGSLTGASPITLEGATANDYETTIGVTDPTADRTLTLPDYTGAVPIVVQQGYTQTSCNNTTSDVTGSSLTLADGWFTEGKALRFVLGGTSAGGNAVVGVDLYVEDGSKMALDTASAGTGDWTAEFTIVATGAATQRIVGILRSEAGAEIITDYATAAVNTATAGTIPIKCQLTTGDAGDTMTAEYVRIEHWTLTD